MGLFDVFKKKDCEICGKEVGLLGYKKLEDGEICKDCVKLLSPWFEDRRHATVAQIKEQIAYREENAVALKTFRPTKVIGEYYMVYLDEAGRRFFVTQNSDYSQENPDILTFDQVLSCDLKISEDKTELKREVTDKEGNTKYVSYVPQRFLYEYDFDMIIRVRHPYFDDMRFRLNRATLELETSGARPGGLINYGVGTMDPTRDIGYRNYVSMGEEIKQILTSAPAAPAAQSAGAEPLLKMIEQIKCAPDLGTVFNLQSEIAHQATNLPEFDWSRIKALTEAAVEAAKQRIIAQETGSAPVQEAPKPKFCPNCGAPYEGGKFCQSCGSKLG